VFQESQDEAYLALCVERVRTQYLTWVEQFLDLLEERLQWDRPRTLNDVGCNLGQFWKGLARRELEVEYRGFDVEEVYIREAEQVFPELAGKLSLHDVTAEAPPPADITVVSATLEHLPALQPALHHLLDSTGEALVIRTLMGDSAETALRHKPGAARPYPIHQYSFVELLEACDRRGFDTAVLRDRHTDSLPVYLGDGIVRRQYVVIARRADA
jgi:SAM-dependent methyltransferase